MKLKAICIAVGYACYVMGSQYQQRQQQLQVWRGLNTTAHP